MVRTGYGQWKRFDCNLSSRGKFSQSNVRGCRRFDGCCIDAFWAFHGGHRDQIRAPHSEHTGLPLVYGRGRWGTLKPVNRATTLSAAVLSFLGFIAISSPPANALTISCGTTGSYWHRFDGWLSGQTSSYDFDVEGTSASITSEFGYICDTDTSQLNHGGNFTTVWVMIAGHGSTAGYAQAGLMRFVNQTDNNLYAEDNATGGANTYRRVFAGTVTYGNIRRYWVQWITGTTSCGDTIRENYNSTIMQTTNFDPLCESAWAQPWISQFLGETLYPSTDIDGYSDAPVTFSSMQTQSYNTNAWSSGAPGLNSRDDNPTSGSALATYCSDNHLSCDTFAHSSVSSNSFTIDTPTHH